MAEAMELRRDAKGEPLFGALVKFAMGSVGAKVLMALTGLFLWVFITGHLLGNLTIYGGPEWFNGYAAKLHATPALVWAVRLALLVGFPLHIFTAIRTAQLNEDARPVPYAYQNRSPARLSAKSMLLSGGTVLAFFAYHIAHFTLRYVGPQPTALLPDGHFDAYRMVVLGFQNPLISGLYLIGQVLLAMHLSHGLYSMFQHFGLWGAQWTPWLKNAAIVIGYGMCAAFSSIPLAVLLGIIKP
jgi:succinate dehydrogenase / fumarate reductase cytochrome b subunit